MKTFFKYFLPWLGRRAAGEFCSRFGFIWYGFKQAWDGYKSCFTDGIFYAILANLLTGMLVFSFDLLIFKVYCDTTGIKPNSPAGNEIFLSNIIIFGTIWAVQTVLMIIVGQYQIFKDEQMAMLEALQNDPD